MSVGIMKNHFNSVFAMAAPDPGIAVFLADYDGNPVQFTHVIMKSTQGSVRLAGAVLFVCLDEIKRNTLWITTLNHVAREEPDQFFAFEQGH